MTFKLTRIQIVMSLTATSILLCASLFPHSGPPHFRYTGCDPDRDVWNLGVPLATCIYDPATSPHLFIGPFGDICTAVALVGWIVVYSAMIAWNNRRMFLCRSASGGEIMPASQK